MKAFHGKQEIKDKYLKRVREHREADNLVQGLTWENGKGCAIGCTLENYSYEQFETELGIPKWFSYLEDKIFEGLSEAEAQMWPENVLKAIPIGCDVEKLKNKILIVIVKEARSHVDERFKEQLNAINRVLDRLGSNASRKELKESAEAAYVAARATNAVTKVNYVTDASYAASKATYAAVYVAVSAEDAAYVARAARVTAEAAASAASAANASDANASDARQKSYKRMADGILKVLKES